MSLVVMITMLVLGSYLYPLPKVRLQWQTPVRKVPKGCLVAQWSSICLWLRL